METLEQALTVTNPIEERCVILVGGPDPCVAANCCRAPSHGAAPLSILCGDQVVMRPVRRILGAPNLRGA